MQRRWFTPFGWTYRPVSWQGWVILCWTFVFCAQIVLVVDATSHSVSDTFYGIFPFVIPALGLFHWVAGHTAGRKDL